MDTDFVIFYAKVRKKNSKFLESSDFLPTCFQFHYVSDFSLCEDNILTEFKTKRAF